jgi:hypothetical protein
MTLELVSLDLMTYIGFKPLDSFIPNPISHDFLLKNPLTFGFDSIDLFLKIY